LLLIFTLVPIFLKGIFDNSIEDRNAMVLIPIFASGE
jgi:hypothetical protein